MQTTVLVRNPFTEVVEAYEASNAAHLQQQLEDRWGHTGLEIMADGIELSELCLDHLLGAILDVRVSVLGGKGGYGSLLRIAAAQKKHFNNFDSSRDAMGRRLRDIKNEHRLIQFVKKKQQEQETIEREKKALEELKRQQKMLKPSSRELAAKSVEESYTKQIDERESVMRNLVARAYLAKRVPKHLEEVEELEPVKDLKQPPIKISDPLTKLIHRKTGKAASKLNLGQSSSTGVVKMNAPESEGKLPTKLVSSKVSSFAQSELRKTQGLVAMSVQPASSSAVTDELPRKPIDLDELKSFDQVLKIDPELVKQELKRLGLKCGGRPEERAKRLWDIKVNPSCLLDHRYLAKS